MQRKVTEQGLGGVQDTLKPLCRHPGRRLRPVGWMRSEQLILHLTYQERLEGEPRISSLASEMAAFIDPDGGHSSHWETLANKSLCPFPLTAACRSSEALSSLRRPSLC